MLVSRCRCQGVRDAKESPARCRARCLVGVSLLQGVWPQWSGCLLQGMSSTYDESLSGCGRESCEGCVSSGSSRLKRPSVCSPVLPVNGLLEDKTKVHVAGVPLLSIRIDCRLRRSFRLRHGDVGVVVGVERKGKRHKLCFLFQFASERNGSLACRTRAPRLQYHGSEVVPSLLW